MRNFEAYRAIDGTAALKIDQQGRRARNTRNNVVAFPSSRPRVRAYAPEFEEVGYCEYVKGEARDMVHLYKTGTCAGKSVNNVPPKTCMLIGLISTIAAVVLAII